MTCWQQVFRQTDCTFTSDTPARPGGRKNPFARYHPMLHSKVYYMELPGGNACAFIGSHNVTAFALTGLNGEAAVLLEGPMVSPEFDKVRQHIDTARSQSVAYTPAMKEALRLVDPRVHRRDEGRNEAPAGLEHRPDNSALRQCSAR